MPVDPRVLQNFRSQIVEPIKKTGSVLLLPMFRGMEPKDQEMFEQNLRRFEAFFPKNRHIKTRKSTGDACKLMNKQFLRRKQTRIFNEGSVGTPPVVRYYSERKIKQVPL